MKEKTLCFVMVLAVSLVNVLVVSTPAGAQDNPLAGRVGVLAHREGAGASPAVISNHTLTGTFFDVSGGGTAFCTSGNCLSPSFTVFSEKITCPGVGGHHCTFQITIAAKNQVGSNDLPRNPGENGVYQILVDGVPPVPGPTDSLGYAPIVVGESASPAIGSSYSVTAEVTNLSPNQVHSIFVGVACQEILNDSSGCFEQTGFDNLQIARYRP